MGSPLLLITEQQKKNVKNISQVPPTVVDCTLAAYCSAVPFTTALLATAMLAGFSDGAGVRGSSSLAVSDSPAFCFGRAQRAGACVREF